jgi:hypothetical protein
MVRDKLTLNLSSGNWATNTETYRLDDGRVVTVISDTSRARGLEAPVELSAEQELLWALVQSSKSYECKERARQDVQLKLLRGYD